MENYYQSITASATNQSLNESIQVKAAILELTPEIKNLNGEVTLLRRNLRDYNKSQKNYGRRIEFWTVAMIVLVLVQICIIPNALANILNNWKVIVIVTIIAILFYIRGICD